MAKKKRKKKSQAAPRQAERSQAQSPAPKEPRSPWLIGPGMDLFVYSGITLYSAGLVLLLSRWIEPFKLFFYFNIVFTLAHYAPTWIRAYFEKSEVPNHRWRVLLFPPAFAALAYATYDHPEVLVFIVYIWDRFHALMQNYGFLRLYESRRKRAQPVSGKIDFFFLLSTALLTMSFNMGLMAPALSHFYVMGLPLGGEATVYTLRAIFGFATLATGTLYVRALYRQHRSDGFSGPKLIFLASTVGGHLIMNSTTNIYLLSAHEKIYHSVQYLVLSHTYIRKKASSLAKDQMYGLYRAMAGKWGSVYYLLFAGLWALLVYSIDTYLPSGINQQTGIMTTVVAGIALSHYYFDSFLWRVRRASVRSSL